MFAQFVELQVVAAIFSIMLSETETQNYNLKNVFKLHRYSNEIAFTPVRQTLEQKVSGVPLGQVYLCRFLSNFQHYFTNGTGNIIQ